jgi:2-polyprenyl-3-methyl-5-hydroxy-6-metoxy-1,4-benzoquinol methylase
MDHRDRLYASYASSHTSRLYGEVSLPAIRAQFSTWQAYFGRWLPDTKDARLLDLGCGNGGLVYWLRQQGYGLAEGIDLSKEQVAAGKKLGIKGISEARIEDHLPAHPEEYDLIFARDVLEHFKKEELLPLLDQIYAALRPGGVFVAQTVNAENPLWGRLRHGDFTHEIAFTDNSMRQVLASAGFNKVETAPQRPVAHGLLSAARAALWRGMEILLSGYLLIETGSAKGIFTQNILVRAKK